VAKQSPLGVFICETQATFGRYFGFSGGVEVGFFSLVNASHYAVLIKNKLLEWKMPL
jgi:hypothetical protein